MLRINNINIQAGYLDLDNIFNSLSTVSMRTTNSINDSQQQNTIEKKQIIDCEEIEHTMSERRILSQLHHPFLVNLHYSVISSVKKNLLMVMDYKLLNLQKINLSIMLLHTN